MDDDELFELEVDSVSQATATATATATPNAHGPSETENNSASHSESEVLLDHSADQTGDSTPTSAQVMPCKRPHAVTDGAQERANKMMGTSLPIAIPMSNSFKARADKEAQEMPEQSATFIPPHQLSQMDSHYMDGAVPEAGLRPSLLRQRNEIFRKTGFLEATVTDFKISRVSIPGAEQFIAHEGLAHRGGLALALTPVPETQVSVTLAHGMAP